jgi:hypothetical protein
MPRQFTKGLDLMRHQQKRFRAMDMDARRGHADMAKAGLADAKELTSRADGPSGPARKRWLARMGHPFGRGASAAQRTPTGLKRGIPRGKGRVRNLPIGQISNKLHSTMRLTRLQGGVQSFGVKTSAPHARFILSPHGTKLMTGRGYGGIQGKNAPRTGETVRRWRARNKAFFQHFKRKQRTT